MNFQSHSCESCDPNSSNACVVDLIERFREFEENSENGMDLEQDKKEIGEQYQFSKTLDDIDHMRFMCNERGICFAYTNHTHWCTRIAVGNTCDRTCESPDSYIYEWYSPQISISIHVDEPYFN